MAAIKSRAKEVFSGDNSFAELHNFAMAQWEPPKGMKKVNFMMREDLHRRILVIAAETGKKPWQVVESLLEKALKPKKA